jgi:hypothetical protein
MSSGPLWLTLSLALCEIKFLASPARGRQAWKNSAKNKIKNGRRADCGLSRPSQVNVMWTATNAKLTAYGFNGRRDHGHDHGHRGRARGHRAPYSGRDRVHDRDPIYGHVRRDRDRLPSSRYRSALHRGAGRPNVHLHRVAGSNSLHASDSGLKRDTSSRQSRRIRVRAARELQRQRVAPVAHRCESQPIFARWRGSLPRTS